MSGVAMTTPQIGSSAKISNTLAALLSSNTNASKKLSSGASLYSLKKRSSGLVIGESTLKKSRILRDMISFSDEGDDGDHPKALLSHKRKVHTLLPEDSLTGKKEKNVDDNMNLKPIPAIVWNLSK
mmetsp:Transcript_12464/g.20258  ORF Transcript_12464/g.20258 Transcript_12464/m.20258 type:complete len:126 (-) Transcript_12464:135-512(-)